MVVTELVISEALTAAGVKHSSVEIRGTRSGANVLVNLPSDAAAAAEVLEGLGLFVADVDPDQVYAQA